MFPVGAYQRTTAIRTLRDSLDKAQSEGQGDDDFLLKSDVDAYVKNHSVSPELARAMLAIYRQAAAATDRQNPDVIKNSADDYYVQTTLARTARVLGKWMKDPAKPLSMTAE